MLGKSTFGKCVGRDYQDPLVGVLQILRGDYQGVCNCGIQDAYGAIAKEQIGVEMSGLKRTSCLA